MGLIKVPPRFEMRAHPVTPGTPFQIWISMICREAVPLDCVYIELEGRITVTPPLVYGGSTPTHYPIRIGARRFVLVDRPAEFASGHFEYTVQASIPPGFPAVQYGPLTRVSWTVTAHASIPWWPDTRRAFPLRVASGQSGGTRQASPPRMVASSPSGPAGRSAYAEVTLANTVVAPGGTVDGLVSLGNCRFHHYRQLRLKLLQRVDGPAVGGAMRATTASHFLHLSAPRDHQPIPFRLVIPPATAAGFTLPRITMRWALQCSVHSGSSTKVSLELPLDIVPPATSIVAHGPAPSLAMVGSDRIARVWSQVAADTGFTFDGTALSLRTEQAAIRIALETDDHGTRLDIDIRFRAVDIGLHVKRGRLRCHDATQSRMIANATDALTSWLRASYADNRHVSVKAYDGGTHRTRLSRYAQWAAHLTTALLDARARLPPPANATHLLAGFERAARRLDARLDPVGMDVWGTRDDLPFSVETRWGVTGRLLNTTIGTGTSIPVDGRHRGQFAPPFAEEGLLDGLQPLLEGATGLLIVDRGIEISYPPNPDRIDDYVDRLLALIEVARRLSMIDGVYR